MIMPKVKIETGSTGLDKWCLFGKLALTASSQTDQLQKTIRRLGGKVDLQIELAECDMETATALLNDGASEIVVPIDRLQEFSEAIPRERLRVATNEIGELDGIGTNRLLKCQELTDANLEMLAGSTPGGTVQIEPENDLTPQQLAQLHRANIDCLIDPLGLETDQYFAESLSLMLGTDRTDGLWPTIITDELGTALGLAYSNRESLLQAIQTRSGVYWSRSRNELWVKGKSSGATQELLQITLDCDSDCLRFTVRQELPGFCHRETYTCFGAERNIQAVIARLHDRIHGADENSFTKKLANDANMLETKLLEEATELSDANSPEEIAWEAADVLYFSLVKLVNSGVSLNEVYGELARRMNRVVRRK